MNKPRPLNGMEIASGQLPTWCENYATWLSEQPSFQNETNRAAFGRVRAIRALLKKLRVMLPSAGWSDLQVEKIALDIRDAAKLKARADIWKH
jgi:hypothetical protein